MDRNEATPPSPEDPMRLRFTFGPDPDWKDEYRLVPMAFDNGQWQRRMYNLATGEGSWQNVGSLVRGKRVILTTRPETPE